MSKDLSVRLHGEEIGILRLVNGKMEFTYSEKAKAPISTKFLVITSFVALE